MTHAELVALLREARDEIVDIWRDRECATHLKADCQTCLHLTTPLDRIDAALAAHDAVLPSEEKVKTDPWWSPSSHRASEGKCDLHVWRMSLKEWGWSTTVYRDHKRGREDLGSGVCDTLDEAQRAALAAARGTK